MPLLYSKGTHIEQEHHHAVVGALVDYERRKCCHPNTLTIHYGVTVKLKLDVDKLQSDTRQISNAFQGGEVNTWWAVMQAGFGVLSLYSNGIHPSCGILTGTLQKH